MINLIPMPENIKEFQGGYSIDRDAVSLFFDKELECISEIVPEILKITAIEPEKNVDISFIYDSKAVENSYSLSISDSGVKVYASSYEGAFYGLTTIRQLYKTDITDKPKEKNSLIFFML